MKIIFAQGNPGQAYTYSRHNVGFLFIDRIALTHGAHFVSKPKFHANTAEVTVGGEKIILVKPDTFYNETGQAARSLIDFYKLNPATDLLVVYDDLALPFGTLRTREKGSDAGNNGIKSLNAHIGSRYPRIRVGIYNDRRTQMPDAEFVLAHFDQAEKHTLPALYQQVEYFVDRFVKNDFEMTKVSLPG